MNNYISICDVHFSYKNEFHLKIPSLNIIKNEKIAFIGPSGCGKTTLISLIAGIYKPQSGTISIENTAINLMSDKNRRDYRSHNIGFVFQSFELLDYLDVKNNILLPYIMSQTKISSKVTERLLYLAKNMGLEDKISQKPHQLSQGEKQRVAIARALIHQPKIIIADEPTGNLDPNNSQKIMDLLCKETQDKITFIMVTHDHTLLHQFDRVIDFGNNFEVKECK